MDTAELAVHVVGYAAAICMVFGYLPQAIYTIRTRDTDGIAVPTFLLMGAGSVFFVIQGLLLHNWPLVITNIITALCSAIVFGIKMYNDHIKKPRDLKRAAREVIADEQKADEQAKAVPGNDLNENKPQKDTK